MISRSIGIGWNWESSANTARVIYGHRIVIDEAGQEAGRWIVPRHDVQAIRHFDYVPQETLFWRQSLYAAVGGMNQSFRFGPSASIYPCWRMLPQSPLLSGLLPSSQPTKNTFALGYRR